jgi:L-rhamnose mutarotase
VNEVRRIASVIALPEAGWQEYERLHSAVWTGVLERLRASHMTNYSIFRYGELLFSYLEYVGDDYETDNAAIAADPITQEWWKLCNPLQGRVSAAEDGEWWHVLPEIFHVD